MLGNTGAGKSTLINQIEEASLIDPATYEEVNRIPRPNEVLENIQLVRSLLMISFLFPLLFDFSLIRETQNLAMMP